MLVAREFQLYVKEVTKSQGREDLHFVEHSWADFCELYSRILQTPFGEPGMIQHKCLAYWRQIAEVVAYDLSSSKHLLDDGFLVQSPAMLRPAMEFGANLTVLAWTGKLSDWVEGRNVDVQWVTRKGLIKKSLDKCAYGDLVACLKWFVEESKTLGSDPQLTVISEELLAVHEGFRRTLNTNKYIHKSREVVTLLRRLFHDFVESFSLDRQDEAIKAGILDLRFEFMVTLDRCLLNQVASRYMEFVRLCEVAGISLTSEIRSNLVHFADEFAATLEKFEADVQPHFSSWTARHASGES